MTSHVFAETSSFIRVTQLPTSQRGSTIEPSNFQDVGELTALSNHPNKDNRPALSFTASRGAEPPRSVAELLVGGPNAECRNRGTGCRHSTVFRVALPEHLPHLLPYSPL